MAHQAIIKIRTGYLDISVTSYIIQQDVMYLLVSFIHASMCTFILRSKPSSLLLPVTILYSKLLEMTPSIHMVNNTHDSWQQSEYFPQCKTLSVNVKKSVCKTKKTKENSSLMMAITVCFSPMFTLEHTEKLNFVNKINVIA